MVKVGYRELNLIYVSTTGRHIERRDYRHMREWKGIFNTHG
jgi:hypothetical protein